MCVCHIHWMCCNSVTLFILYTWHLLPLFSPELNLQACTHRAQRATLELRCHLQSTVFLFYCHGWGLWWGGMGRGCFLQTQWHHWPTDRSLQGSQSHTNSLRQNPEVCHAGYAQWHCHGVTACSFLLFWLWRSTKHIRLLICLVSVFFMSIIYFLGESQNVNRLFLQSHSLVLLMLKEQNPAEEALNLELHRIDTSKALNKLELSCFDSWQQYKEIIATIIMLNVFFSDKSIVSSLSFYLTSAEVSICCVAAGSEVTNNSSLWMGAWYCLSFVAWSVTLPPLHTQHSEPGMGRTHGREDFMLRCLVCLYVSS